MRPTFDAVIIGTGQAGPSLATRLAQTGAQVAIIEKGQFGGTCVNNGCIPTKTLIASARGAYMAQRSAEYGVNVGGEVTVDMKAVKDGVEEVLGRTATDFSAYVHKTLNAGIWDKNAMVKSR